MLGEVLAKHEILDFFSECFYKLVSLLHW